MSMAVDPLINTTIGGRYKILQRIGAGGMGTVYKARQIFMNEIVALKIIRPEFRFNRVFVERFLREVRNASRVKHANTILILDSGELESGQLYIAMEYIHGKSLGQILDNHPSGLPMPIVHFLFRQICTALIEVHRHRIVHRDLKPENILCSLDARRAPRVKVADFGISLALESHSLTTSGAIVGTPLYMSPEQGMGRTVDARSDIYSLGVILYTMLTGTPPFAAGSALGIISAHNFEAVPPPSRKRMEISTALEEVIQHALAKRPEGRYRTVEELLEAFRQAMVPILHLSRTTGGSRANLDRRRAFAIRNRAGAAVQKAGRERVIAAEAVPDPGRRSAAHRLAVTALTCVLLLGTMYNVYVASMPPALNYHGESQTESIAPDSGAVQEPGKATPAAGANSVMTAKQLRGPAAPALSSPEPSSTPLPPRIVDSGRAPLPRLTFPVANGVPSMRQWDAEKFVAAYLAGLNGGSLSAEVEFYDRFVDYQYRGILETESIRRAAGEWRARWPERYHRVSERVVVRQGPDEGSVELQFPCEFSLYNRVSNRGIAGRLQVVLTLSRIDGMWKISAERRDPVEVDAFGEMHN